MNIVPKDITTIGVGMDCGNKIAILNQTVASKMNEPNLTSQTIKDMPTKLRRKVNWKL